MSPSGDYAVDCRTGEEYAVAYLRYRAIDKCTAPSLPSIVADQTRDLSGIEVGFLSMIDYAEVHGLIAAERLLAYWKEEETATKRHGRRKRRPKLKLVWNSTGNTAA